MCDSDNETIDVHYDEDIQSASKILSHDEIDFNLPFLRCHMCPNIDVVLAKDPVSRIYFIDCANCKHQNWISHLDKFIYIPIKYRTEDKLYRYVKVELDK